jgi:hypothetical protein
MVSPNGAYSVTLPTGNETVTLDVSPTIDSLLLGTGVTLQTDAGTSLTTGSLNNSGNINFTSGGTLTVNGAVTMGGPYYNGLSIGEATTVSIAGDVTNSEQFNTGYRGGNNTVTVNGTFTNTSNGSLSLTSSGDVVNVNALNNQGSVNVDGGTTLNITGGGPGITDVVASSSYEINPGGTFNVINGGVATNALANLASIEGNLYLLSGQAYNFGSLTMSGPYYNGLSIGEATTVSIAGDVTNSEQFNTGYRGGNNTVAVSGTFTNTSNGSLSLTSSGDVVNVNALNNQGSVNVNTGALLLVGSGSSSATSGLQQLANGIFDEIISGAGTYGLANIDGPVALDGTLEVTLDDGFTPSLGESFTYLDGTPDEMSGAYASVIGQPFAGGQWQVAYNNAAGTVTLTAIEAVPEPTSLAMLCLGGFGLLRRTRRSVRR